MQGYSQEDHSSAWDKKLPGKNSEKSMHCNDNRIAKVIVYPLDHETGKNEK